MENTGAKPKRAEYDDDQKRRFEKEFAANRYPSKEEIEVIANELNLTSEQVYIR